MSDGQTKNAVLKTALSFHYQVLIGLKHCFAMQEGQSVWFEQDGDVSLIGDSVKQSKQVEVKNYADVLTDHHENLWRTLKNWLAPEFKHEIYGSLVLHTTQAFSATTSLNDWNKQDPEQRINTLQAIFSKRSQTELTAKKPKLIVSLQKAVMETEREHLKNVLAKVVLFTEADNEGSLRESMISQFRGIPKNNHNSYIQGLVGFIYENSNATQWEISETAFTEKCIELTAVYHKRHFTLPTFTGREATKEELAAYEEKLFVYKIQCIKYEEMLPEAIGNWIELHNSLSEELDGAPQFRTKTNEYQSQLISRFEHMHAKAKRDCNDPIRNAKNLYNEVIGEWPAAIDGYSNPPFAYKNGLIHDAMDDDERNLHWKVGP